LLIERLLRKVVARSGKATVDKVSTVVSKDRRRFFTLNRSLLWWAGL